MGAFELYHADILDEDLQEAMGCYGRERCVELPGSVPYRVGDPAMSRPFLAAWRDGAPPVCS